MSNKYHGNIGFREYVETYPDVWEENIVERPYVGNVLKNVDQNRSGNYLNDDIVITNRISIVCDPYAFERVNEIKYCEWLGNKWRVQSIETAYPRLILTLGGVYSEQSSGN